MDSNSAEMGVMVASVLIIIFLWLWTMKRPKAYLFFKEVELRRQNRHASVAFALCLVLQVMTFQPSTTSLKIWVGVMSFLSLLSFIWFSTPNRLSTLRISRLQATLILLISLVYILYTIYLNHLFILPAATSFLIATICQKRFVDLLSDTLRDMETLKAKLLKKEADLHNQSIAYQKK